MVRRFFSLVLLGGFLLIWSLRFLAPGFALPQPAHLGQIQPAVFADHDGQTFTMPADLLGRVTVVNLFYSTCHGPCPALMKQLQVIEASRPHDDRVQFVSLSIDSANDTAKTLKAYGQELGLPLGKSWRLVSGAPETVQQFAEKTLHLGVEPGEQLHSTSVVVIDGTGEIRGTFSIMEQEGATRLQSTLTALLKQLPVAASEPDPSANAPR